MRRKVHGARALESSEGAAGGGVSSGTRHANLPVGRPRSAAEMRVERRAGTKVFSKAMM